MICKLYEYDLIIQKGHFLKSDLFIKCFFRFSTIFYKIIPIISNIMAILAWKKNNHFSFSSHSIYKIKQDIRIYVLYSRLISWTEWAEIFCGHSWVARRWHRVKKSNFSPFKFFFVSNLLFFLRATPGLLASTLKIYILVKTPGIVFIIRW